MDIQDLEIAGIVAFDGLTKNALQLHPDNEHFVYPMGNKVTVKHIITGKQAFLSGHTNLISTMCISPCGKYVASGQINHMGFKAKVIIWDYHERKLKSSHEIHKVRIESICFSCDSNFLISLGGRDDGNVVIWNVKKNDALCGAFASTDIGGNAYAVCRTNLRDLCFVTVGDQTLKVWRINVETRKVYGQDVKVGKLKRCVKCVVIDERDENAYCGTSSGDIIKTKLNYYHNMEHMEPVQQPVMIGCYSKISKNAKKRRLGIGDPYSGGVDNLLLWGQNKLVVGTGDGTLELVTITAQVDAKPDKRIKSPSTPQLKTLLAENVRSAVTSMIFWKNEFIVVGTILSEIYQIKLSDFDMRLLVTCHTATIYDVAFPHNYSEIFATSSKNDIRLWRLETQRELLRITVPNFVCTSIYFSYDGRMLVSAWNDGIIRAFTPQTGRLIFAILNAHLKAVSAITLTKDGKKIVSGGCDGQVRMWEIHPEVQKLLCVLKVHRGSVTSLHINHDGTEAISSSTDGTCIIWDIERMVRKQVLMGNTMYMSACFSTNGVQILTCGTDRKIAYWETLDGSMIRELEGSGAGALNCIDVSPDGQYFVTGGNDGVVKFWNYNAGETTHVGMGHAAIITACKISPDGKHIVTASGDGAILIWKCPFEMKVEKTPMKRLAASISSRSTCSLREEEFKKSLSLDLGNENVTDLTPRSEAAESVKAVYKGNGETPVCKCDPIQPLPESCKCKEENTKSPIIETTRSSKSSSSKKSMKNETTSCREKNSKCGSVERKLLA
ncbi:cilia- and flagella-associated protein 52-like [Copidosoma floridanum]|uniref:cilia- and flagella-associated protein 52-like n=1 Tax=Copidosoma floridanum TaxID=29053 RepID=UPI0006C94602|nr:cilia- and flagella-associated protein 52-like [Copidosoma floridanum]